MSVVEEKTPPVTEGQAGKKPGNPRLKLSLIGAGMFLVFVVAYIFTLAGFQNELTTRKLAYGSATTSGPDRVDMLVTVLTIDPIKSIMTVRLDFSPVGAYLAADGKSLNKDVLLQVNSTTGAQDRPFAKGKRMLATEVTLGLDEGDVANYPFDVYKTELDLYMTEVPAKSAAATDALETPVPTDVQFLGSVHGFKIDSALFPQSADGYNFIEITTARSTPTIAFAVVVLGVMVLMTLAVLGVVAWVVFKERKIEFAMFGWIGTLLFAFPAIRNAMPGTPPIGALPDFLAFFWVEGIVGIAMIVLVITWLKRPAGK
ncbi:MAG: hypothetical protein JWP00_4932 [Chloroflexi bacterium]|jgi:hypothetical protein|nr:hypothetical protein [Chloroflexota bacterium]